jgi:molybdopterin-guanine dinucleotide biosynthesis protein B
MDPHVEGTREGPPPEHGISTAETPERSGIVMIPIVCIVGASDSGKTTLLERLIPELTRRGYRIGTVKHDVHGFQMDQEGKDTWRHSRAGAQTIAIASPRGVASIRKTSDELPLEEVVARYFWEEDLVLAEGFKRSRFPKIEVFRSAVEPSPICGPGDNRIALVGDEIEGLEIPRFSFDQIRELADFIEERYLKDRKSHPVLVQIDGKRLPMNAFVQDFFVGSILGMLSRLRGWRKPRSLLIHIRLGEDPLGEDP